MRLVVDANILVAELIRQRCVARFSRLGVWFRGIGETGGRNDPHSDSPLSQQSDLLTSRSPKARNTLLRSDARQSSGSLSVPSGVAPGWLNKLGSNELQQPRRTG